MKMNQTSILSSKSTFGTAPLHNGAGKPTPASGHNRAPSGTPSSGIPAHSDFTLHDKSKLLRLAERIQTKKDGSPRSTPLTGTSTPQRPLPATTPMKSSLAKLEKLSHGPVSHYNGNGSASASASECRTPLSSTPSNFGSRARSKLYASFSSKKSQLIKCDPAKTNIEHLVKKRVASSASTCSSLSDSGSASSSIINGRIKPLNPQPSHSPVLTNTIDIPDTSFHNHTKLVNAFSPTHISPTKRSHQSHGILSARQHHQNDKYYPMENEISPTNDVPEIPLNSGQTSSEHTPNYKPTIMDDWNGNHHRPHAHRHVQRSPNHPAHEIRHSPARPLTPSPKAAHPLPAQDYNDGHHQKLQPRISSAQIVTLARKASLPSSSTIQDEVHPTANANDDDEFNSRIQTVGIQIIDEVNTQPLKHAENQQQQIHHNNNQPLQKHDGSSTWLHNEIQSSPTFIKTTHAPAPAKMKKLMMTKPDCNPKSKAGRSSCAIPASCSLSPIPPPPIPSRKNSKSASTKPKPESETEATSCISHDITKTELFPPPPPRRASNIVQRQTQYYYNGSPSSTIDHHGGGPNNRTRIRFSETTTEFYNEHDHGCGGPTGDKMPANTMINYGNYDDGEMDTGTIANSCIHNGSYSNSNQQQQKWSNGRGSGDGYNGNEIHKIDGCSTGLFLDNNGNNHDDDDQNNYTNDNNNSRISEEEALEIATTTADTSSEDFDRQKTRSLPKSFISMKTGFQNVVLPSHWRRDELPSERIDQKILIPNPTDIRIAPKNSMLPKSTTTMPPEGLKMRQQKTEGRPKSLDYSQRNNWMKVYNNMELESPPHPSPPTDPSGKPNSRTQLHLIDAHEDVMNWRSQSDRNRNTFHDDEYEQKSPKSTPEYPSAGPGSNSSRSNSLSDHTKEVELPRNSTASSSSTNSSQSLFQRFSKTFSLRFGSNNGNSTRDLESRNSSRKKLKSKRFLGSSPDLVSRIGSETECNNYVNGAAKRNSIDSSKYRKGQKCSREDKCYSGDSGIQLVEELQMNKSNQRFLHHAKSLDCENPQPGNGNDGQNLRNNRTTHLRNSMNRLSLVEFPPSQQQQQHSILKPNRQISMTSTNTVSYEDLLESKLDDDGFISNGDDNDILEEDETVDDSFSSNLQRSSDNAYYHSLPLKYLRQRRKVNAASDSGPNPLNPNPNQLKTNTIRGNIIKELLTTEQNYVKTLNDIIQGYLVPCREAKHLFVPKTIYNIFSNIEELLKLHVQFLKDLQFSIEHQLYSENYAGDNSAARNLSDSLVGHVFIVWSDQFHHLYADYCCQNTMSIVTLRQLTGMNSEYVEFFEACRRLQLMDKLPLHGFLLRPIQRICQYHLQLSELVKHTPKTHDDYEAVVEALDRMKLVAARVNETQRQFDMLQELARVQLSIEGFEEPDLLDRNSAILHRGDLVQMNQGSKHKEVYVIILNQEVLVCRKDTTKRGSLALNTRIDLSSSVWLNIDSNEEDDHFGMVHNSWRLYNPFKSNWILFTASSPADKRKWTSALEQTMNQDAFRIPNKMREIAKLTAAKILQTDSLLSSCGNGVTNFSSSSNHHNNNNNNNSTSTLPKFKKNANRKSLSSKIGSESSCSSTDIMLIEVGKLKMRNNGSHHGNSGSHNGSNSNYSAPPVRTSKFYV